MNYVEEYLQEAHKIIDELNPEIIEKIVGLLIDLREAGGRLFS